MIDPALIAQLRHTKCHLPNGFVTTEATGQEASSERESLDDDDVERNADLYYILIMKSLSVNFSLN